MIGIPHDVRPADLDESVLPNEVPSAHAERLARSKAEAVAARHPEAVVIGADTIVVLDGDILGKPGDAAEAVATLRRLSGRTHTVHTAVAVTHQRRTVSGVESVWAGEEIPKEWVLPQVPITEDERSEFLEANDGMPDGHYAKFGGEDLPGYPEVWQERQIP